MRLAFISDIHSNILALLEVHKDIMKQEADKVYCLGDLVSGIGGGAAIER